MALEAYSLCRPNPAAISKGTSPLDTYYTGADIRFHFPYDGFEWLPLLPPAWIYALVGVLAGAAVTLALGLWYRVSAAAVFAAWGYFFLVESTRTYWQSHYYLELLVAFLLIWMPAARRFSLDTWMARDRNPSPGVPFWTLLLLRGQLVIAYFYAGVAKLNADWLLDAVPVRWFLANPDVTVPYEPYLTAAQLGFVKSILHNAGFAYFISYAGLIFDLAVGFLLLIRRTRIFAMILMVLFHAMNHFIIFDDIGWFPLLGVTTALIFLNPDWPQRFWIWARRPRLPRPDWSWFTAGAILFPVVGAALGWKSRVSGRMADARAAGLPGRWTVRFVAVWLVWQALLPIRNYFIPGDGRITYEGQSFSWRLKADVRHSYGLQVLIQDPEIISADAAGGARINWARWQGERVIYRKVTPGRINWATLPEVMVVLEPMIGERIIYNPYARSSPGVRTEADSRERVIGIWRELYGREPQVIRRTEPLSQVIDWISAALRAGGHIPEAQRLAGLSSRTRQAELNRLEPPEARKTRSEVRQVLVAIQHRDEKGQMIPFLRPMDPFALDGESHRASPFLLIEDAKLLNAARVIDGGAWKCGPSTRDHGGHRIENAGGEPMIVYMGDIGASVRDVLPQACIQDSEDHPERPPEIWWNSLKDLTYSKFLHASIQAFYLRRYARRVANLWEEQYGHRPIVHGTTLVSLNGRPHQQLVDPNADLASVTVTWFGHNPWVMDLETQRIPREELTNRPAFWIGARSAGLP
jgi:vitamin K-dependent gamma-carboxylase